MNKISNAQIAEVLADAAAVLRTQSEKIAELEAEREARGVHDRVTKIASEMHRKGINLDTSIPMLIESLEKAAEQQKLEAIEQAVEMVGPDMGSKLAHINNDEQRVSLGSSDLERFIIGAAG